MGVIHRIRIIPGTEKEKRFLKLLKDVGVKEELLMCKRGYIFWTAYDEYVISDGLYNLISEELESMGQ